MSFLDPASLYSTFIPGAIPPRWMVLSSIGPAHPAHRALQAVARKAWSACSANGGCVYWARSGQ